MMWCGISFPGAGNMATWISCCVLFVMASATSAGAGEFTLKKGKQFALCRALHEIINLPVNADILGNYNTARELTIPEEYTYFRPVRWEPVAPDEVAQYVFREDTKKALAAFKKAQIEINKTWDGTGALEFEKTRVNLDHWDGNGKETVLRYRVPGWKVANCLLPDTTDEEYRVSFNRPGNNGFLSRTEGCQLFTYRGRVYHTGRPGALVGLIVYEPEASKLKNKYMHNLYDIDICNFRISFPSSSHPKE